MTRTLYLHIGSHKTGTTSIQHFLADHKDALTARGYSYPVGANGLNLGNVLGGVDAKAREEDAADIGMGRRTRQGIQTMIEGSAPHVIASSEGYSYLHEPTALQTFAKLLGKHFSTIKIISYLRRQDQFAISHHQEGANPQTKPAAKLHGHRPTALPETSALQHNYLDYATRIGMWGDAFGDKNIILRVYDRKALKSGDAVADFLELVGLGDMAVSTLPSKNVSMGLIKSKIGHILNRLTPDQKVKAALLNRLPDEGKLLPARADAVAFVAPYVAGNRALNQRFHINDTPTLFSDDFSIYPETGNDTWTEETANIALAACIDLIGTLSAETFVYNREEYLAAAKALEESKPDLSKRFLDSAMGLRPSSERIKMRATKLEKKRVRTATKTERAETKETRLAEKDQVKAAVKSARKSRNSRRSAAKGAKTNPAVAAQVDTAAAAPAAKATPPVPAPAKARSAKANVPAPQAKAAAPRKAPAKGRPAKSRAAATPKEPVA